jgi:fatty-acyl-CoA synthase
MHRYDWIGRWAAYAPSKEALKCERTGRVLSYAQLNHCANRMALWLTQDCACTPSDRVALLAENSLEHFVLWSACQKTGLAMVPLNYRLAAAELEHQLNDCGPKVVLAANQYLDVLRGVPYCQTVAPHDAAALGTAWYERRDMPIAFESYTGIDEDDPIFILYTSGTTGQPKGVCYTHKMLFWNAVNTILRLDITSADRSVTLMPLFHTGGLNVVPTPFLFHGAYVCLAPKFDADAVLASLARERATMFVAVPTMLHMMAASPQLNNTDLTALRYFVVGGEPMPLPLISFWNERGIPVRQGFGMTEAGPSLTSLHQADAVRKMGSIGTPNFYVDVRVVDDDGRDLPAGQAGEMMVKGPSVTPGYWHKPAETQAAIRDGWLHTGDVVLRDEEGYLFVVDRKKNMYISGGENVYPAEVEKLLATHPAVQEVAIVGVPDEKWGEVGKAFVVTKPGMQVTGQELAQFCAAALAKYKLPRHWLFVTQLPKTDSGKLDRKALKKT